MVRIYFLMILVLVLQACGVKADPSPAYREPLFDNPLEEEDLKLPSKDEPLKKKAP